MNKYVFAVSTYDSADCHIGFRIAAVLAESERLAWLKVEDSKENLRWLMNLFEVDEEDDIAGRVVGDHVLLEKQVADPDSIDVAGLLRDEAIVLSHDGRHDELGTTSSRRTESSKGVGCVSVGARADATPARVTPRRVPS